MIHDKDERAAFRPLAQEEAQGGTQADRVGPRLDGTAAVSVPTQWEAMSPGDKQAWLLALAFDRKREILALPLPDDDDDSAEATRLRALILAAADSTISQTIALRMLTPATAQDKRDAEIEAFIEERRQKMVAMIERMREEPVAWPNGREGHAD